MRCPNFRVIACRSVGFFKTPTVRFTGYSLKYHAKTPLLEHFFGARWGTRWGTKSILLHLDFSIHCGHMENPFLELRWRMLFYSLEQIMNWLMNDAPNASAADVDSCCETLECLPRRPFLFLGDVVEYTYKYCFCNYFWRKQYKNTEVSP